MAMSAGASHDECSVTTSKVGMRFDSYETK
jgi:hypothetical protein